MKGTAVWHSRPVFVSSTFRDMHAERDHLRNKVFPVLEERLKERFHHLELVDLRWGVETAAAEGREAKELLVLKVCLGEIERSRPFLIALLGDRYGWVPADQERMLAAAREAGYRGGLLGKSVTALEIEFGVLASADQGRRSRFYFREPLPYAEMSAEKAAQFSDAHSPDPECRALHATLVKLKKEIEDTLRRQGMSERVRPYTAVWDRDHECVAGLDSWGDQVIEDLWSDLEEETRTFLRQPAVSWQEQERLALDEFVELGCRGFKGRTDVLDALESLATSPSAAGATWGLCLTGTAGSGKSALLSVLLRRLPEEALVLGHAAGISRHSTEVDSVLRRWTYELAQFLRVSDPAPDLGAREDLEAAFAELLSRASGRQRVVCLIDALNQFERTTAAMNLTWLPKLWPENARLVATAIAGAESEALGRRPGVDLRPLPALDEREASQIVTGLCARKTLHPEIRQVLLSKTRDDGALAAGNPLWLTLAMDELLLLDANDFARADRELTGSPEQRLHALLLDTAACLPGEVESLYQYLLERTEQIHGAPWARGLAKLIAVTRGGLRESDIETLLPKEAAESWNPLRFAELRRSFRAHIVRRRALLQWDFFHSQMRIAVERLYLADPGEKRRLHAAIAEHLESLPGEDQLRQTELVVHYIGADDRQRAARHYGDASLVEADEAGATRALAAHIIAGCEADPNPGLEWVCALVQQPDIGETIVGVLCNQFNFDLHDALKNDTRLGTRLALLRAAEAALTRLAAADPTNTDWQYDLAVSQIKIGEHLLSQGNAQAALQTCRQARASAERLVAAAPSNIDWQRALLASNIKIGDVLLAQGDAEAALHVYRQALAIAERFVAFDPTDADWQRGLSVSHARIGHVLLRAEGDSQAALHAYRQALAISERFAAFDPTNADWQHNLSGSHDKIGDVLLAQGDPQAALHAYRQCLIIAERLAASEPTNAGWKRGLSVSHIKIGDVLLRAQGDPQAALHAYRQALTIAEDLAASDPTNAGWQHDLSSSHIKIGDVLLRVQGDAQAALHAYRQSLALTERLVASDPTNADCQRDLWVSHIKIGDVLLAQGDSPAALHAYRQSLGLAERLARSDLTNAGWQRDLWVSHIKIGNVLLDQGDAQAALHAFWQCFGLAERLAGSDPTNADWQRDLVVSHFGLARVFERMGDDASAGQHKLRCRDALHSMHRAGMFLDPPLEKLRAQLETSTPARVDHPAPLPSASADDAATRNIAHQLALAAWRALPLWKRLRVKKPEPPRGI